VRLHELDEIPAGDLEHHGRIELQRLLLVVDRQADELELNGNP